MSKPTKQPPAPKEAPKAKLYPSASLLEVGDHFPKAIDLRPYHPTFESAGPTSAAAGAIAAAFARTGRPLPFVPSPEHLAAIGGHRGVNQYGVRPDGVRMGNPPTEYDLTADSIPLSVEVFEVTSTGQPKIDETRSAFAAGYAVRVGDAFLVAYSTSEEDSAIFTLSDGSAFSQGFLGDEPVHVWKVERAS